VEAGLLVILPALLQAVMEALVARAQAVAVEADLQTALTLELVVTVVMAWFL
jgi:hypothetical protein